MSGEAKRVHWKKRIPLFKQGQNRRTGVNDGTASDKEGNGANAETRILAVMIVVGESNFIMTSPQVALVIIASRLLLSLAIIHDGSSGYNPLGKPMQYLVILLANSSWYQIS